MKRPPDMSRAEFNAALKRRGWRQVLLWIDVSNAEFRGGWSIGLVTIDGKVNRRASLAHAIRETEKAKAAKALESEPPYDYAADDRNFDAAREDRVFGKGR